MRTRPPGGFYYDLTGSAPSPRTTPSTPSSATAGPTRRPRPLPRPAGAGPALHEETDYAVVLDVNCAFFLRCAELRGWENFYVDLVGNPEFAEALMDRYLDIRLADRQARCSRRRRVRRRRRLHQRRPRHAPTGTDHLARALPRAGQAAPEADLRLLQGAHDGQALLPLRRRHLPAPGRLRRARRGGRSTRCRSRRRAWATRRS